jgi:hypothetical protein
MDQLVRRQHYLNVQLDLNETEFKILHIRNCLTTTVNSHEETLNKEGI